MVPTEPGWYWAMPKFENPKPYTPSIVWVHRTYDGPSYFAVLMVGTNDAYDLNQFENWKGPIPYPG